MSCLVAFIVLYAVCLFGLVMPFAYLELAIGQYTSLPVSVLYERVGPIFSGTHLEK